MEQPAPPTDQPAAGAPAPVPTARRPLVLGILGGIASGKSALARLLAGPDGVLIDADSIAHQELETPLVRAWIEANIGPGALTPSAVDRAQVARSVFASPALRAELEALVHPAVRARLREELASARAQSRPRIVLDVPLLLENEAQHELTRECDALVFIDSDATVRAERALRTRGWSNEEFARRQAAQLPLEIKRSRADVVIPNHGDWAQTANFAREALNELERRRTAP